MVVSTSRSTSKRGYWTSSTAKSSSSKEMAAENRDKKNGHRRCRSVSAVARNHQHSSSVIVDFLNKRDNPLFSDSSSPPSSEEGKLAFTSKISNLDKKITISREDSSRFADSRRGRSVLRRHDHRNPTSKDCKVNGRSLSRVDTGRRRSSLSRGPCASSQSEREQKCNLTSTLRSKNLGDSVSNEKKKCVQTTNKDTRNLRRWCSQHPIPDVPDVPDGAATSEQSSNWEDETYTDSYSEAEDKAFFELMKSLNIETNAADVQGHETVQSEPEVIHIRNSSRIAAIDTDIPHELVNPGAVELVSDIRRQYATKLEQSNERASRLRADLAIEEQRGLEFSRILKEILPNPKTPEAFRSRSRRKTSVERRKMSKLLTQEAMSYFDECVSISTFEGSDLSSDEAAQHSDANPMLGPSRLFSSDASSSSVTYPLDHRQVIHYKEENSQVECCTETRTNIYQDTRNYETSRSENSLFSFSTDKNDKFEAENISEYIKKFEKGSKKEPFLIAKSSYSEDDYNSSFTLEHLLFDKVFFKKRIEYGGLLLCGTSRMRFPV